MTYERFMCEFWEHTKFLAVHPVFSLGDILLMLAWLAYQPPWWITGPAFFVWMLLIINRQRTAP